MDIAQTFAATFVDELAAQGVEYACVSPGSRSAPIAMALQRHPRIKVIMHVDERSGSFFGLGIGKATGKPAVLLCTSGTAAAEFHPAVVEASYSRTPMIVITADRPPELQDVGANQAIDQQRLYGTAVRWFFDPGVPVEIPGAARVWRRLAARAVAESAGGPVHINLPFREPLAPTPGQGPSAEGGAGQTVTSGRVLPTQAQLANLASALQGARRPLVVAGDMRDGERLAPALMRLGLPVLAEPGSQLRRAETGGAVEAYEALLRAGWSLQHGPDLVIRIGGTPTSRALNAWLAAASAPTFLIDPDRAWRDQDHIARHVVACDPQALLEALPPVNRMAWRDEWMSAGKEAGAGMCATAHPPADPRGPQRARARRALTRRGPGVRRLEHADPCRRQLLAAVQTAAAILWQSRRERHRRPCVHRPGSRHRPQRGSDRPLARRSLCVSRHERAVGDRTSWRQGDGHRLRQQRRRRLQLPAPGPAPRCVRRDLRDAARPRLRASRPPVRTGIQSGHRPFGPRARDQRRHRQGDPDDGRGAVKA